MSTEPEPAADAAPTSTKRGRFPLMMVAGVGLLLGATVGVLVVGPRFVGGSARAAAVSSDSAEDAHAEEAGKGGKPRPTTPLHIVDNLVLNPANSGGTRFLLLSVALDVADEKVSAEMTSRDAEVRDIILRILGNKEVQQLTALEQREQIRIEMRDTLAARFGRSSVRQVYFPQFVIQ
jgi:flagellar FliL protein